MLPRQAAAAPPPLTESTRAGSCALALLLLLVPTCSGLTIDVLGTLPTPDTVGGAKVSARAVYCDGEGYFTSLQAINPTRGYTATLQVCCSIGSNARYEGDGSAAHSQCVQLGAGSVSSAFFDGTSEVDPNAIYNFRSVDEILASSERPLYLQILFPGKLSCLLVLSVWGSVPPW